MSLLNNQKFLQNAIMVMSILILAGLAILVHGIVKKSGSSGGAGISLSTPSVDAPDGTLVVQLPPRSQIAHMTSYNGGVALYTRTASGNFIYFVNSQTGKIDGALKIDTLPPARGPLQR
ncbi:MAG: hypothetical protein Q8K65_06445 [Alphaproteobacteria bacterium]|nr:hypothetical protein [Alphaproteobacteria bacterium]